MSFFVSFFPGVIGIGKPVDMSETRGALHAFNIPLIAVGHKNVDNKHHDNILSTAPDVQGQAQVLEYYKWIVVDGRKKCSACLPIDIDIELTPPPCRRLTLCERGKRKQPQKYQARPTHLDHSSFIPVIVAA